MTDALSKGPGLRPFVLAGPAHEVAARWKKWKRSFQYFADGTGITDPARKRALLLHHAGVGVQDRFDTLREDADVDDVFTRALEALDASFVYVPNKRFERYQLRLLEQQEEETVGQFVARLQTQAAHCSFGDNDAVDDHVCDQLLAKMRDHDLRKKLLGESELTLEKALRFSRQYEATEAQARGMTTGSSFARVEQVNVVKRQAESTGRTCHNCGRSGHFARDKDCPARGKSCANCGRIGHFALKCRSEPADGSHASKSRGKSQPPRRACRARRVADHGMESEIESDEDEATAYVFTVGRTKVKQPQVTLTVDGVEMEAIVDSGATCNIVGEATLAELHSHGLRYKLVKSKKRLFAYGGTQLPVKGKFNAALSVGGKKVQADVIVIAGKGEFLLGRPTSLQLETIVLPDVNCVESTSFKTALPRQYPTVFKGVGKLVGYKADLHIDREVTPVAQPQRRVPYAYQEGVDRKLHELMDLDVIEESEGPTPWISPVVIAPKKNGDIRLCVDLRRVNQAVARERHPMPTVDEILHEVNGSSVFSKLDLRWGFHQVELAESSRYVTTFVANGRLYRYKRLPFGISAAPELYQKIIRDVIKDLPGVVNAADDILIHGRSQEEHDERLHAVMRRLESVNLTVNESKCEFSQHSMEFYGLQLTDQGIKPTPDKVQALIETTPPRNAAEVRSFLGTVGFSARFIPDLSTTTEPLRRLTIAGTRFHWGKEQQAAFDKLKHQLASSTALAYFSTTAKTQLMADASPVGLGAVLIQEQDGNQQAVGYASRTLSPVERRYSQTEREALALVWACERFHTYLLGRQFTLLTDHKPLEVIYSARSKPSARIERWVLRLQPYDFIVRYVPGRCNIADALSRMPGKALSSSDADEEAIRRIAEAAAPVAIGVDDVEEASAADEELSAIRRVVQSGALDKLPEAYRNVRLELAVLGQLVLRGQRLVIPSSLRRQTLKLAHEGHQGITKTKERLRSKVWWPGMDREAEKMCRSCHACQVVGPPSAPPEVKPTTLPEGPWQQLAADLLGSGDDYVLVLVDYYSRFYEVDILQRTNAEVVIQCLDAHFSRHGVPASLRTDNGPPFNSDAFSTFLREKGIVHVRNTPLWPRSNGEVERQNRSLMKAIRAAHVEGRNVRQALNEFLLAYRSTLHPATGKTPSALLYNRELKTKLPSFSSIIYDQGVRDRDAEYKQRMKDYADTRRHASDQPTQVGDKVLLRRPAPTVKKESMFLPEPHTIVDRHGDQVMVESSDGVQRRRNIQFTKPYVEPDVVEHDQKPSQAPTVSGSALSPDQRVRLDESAAESSSASTERPSRHRIPPVWMKDYIG